jgi:hypothetical protein
MSEKDIFFSQMDMIINLIDGNRRKTEFIKTFFKDELGIVDIENSVISFEKMNSKVFFYLLLSLVIEYADNLENGDSTSDHEVDN